jgi:adenylate cyclase
MGVENRLNYTVIGSNVNLAARLCSAAERMEILISKDTLNEPFTSSPTYLSIVKDSINYEEIPLNTFKGFDQPVQVFHVLGLK